MTREDTLIIGFLIGAVLTGWLASSNLKHQRDYWKDAYCRETSLELSFCEETAP